MAKKNHSERRLMRTTEAVEFSCPQWLLLLQHAAKASAHRWSLSHTDIQTHSSHSPSSSCLMLETFQLLKMLTIGKRKKG